MPNNNTKFTDWLKGMFISLLIVGCLAFGANFLA